MTLSEKCEEQPAQYLGILNGVWYRMDAGMSGSGEVFRLTPQDVPPSSVTARLMPGMRNLFAAFPVPTPAAPASREALQFRDSPPAKTDAACEVLERHEKSVKPYHRDSAEPLRAGHPDLWNLLVAGTCLEGCAYKSE